MASDHPSVFCTIGHGCEFPGQPAKKVPPGCMYITIGLCGMGSIDLPKILIAFRDPLLKEALQHPDYQLIWRVLNEYLGLTGDNLLRIHKAGDDYTDSFIELWSPLDRFYFKSGIYQLGRGEEIRQPGEIYREMGEGVKMVSHPSQLEDKELLTFLYEDAIYPKLDRGDRVEYMYSDMMRELPGIYYHLACRTICNPNVPNALEQIALRQQNSENQMVAQGRSYQLAESKNPNWTVQSHIPMGRDHGERLALWNNYRTDSFRRLRWKHMIDISLEVINTAKREAALAAARRASESYNNALPNYINAPAPTAATAAASSASNHNVSSINSALSNYVNVAAPAASVAESVASASSSNNESNANDESNSNEETRTRRALRQEHKKLKAILSGIENNGTLTSSANASSANQSSKKRKFRKGGRATRNTRRKKTNRKRKQTRKHK